MKKLFSIKARASCEGKHVSGAERIVPEEKIFQTLEWIQNKLKGKNFDSLNIKINLIKEKPLIVKKALPIIDMKFKDYEEANKKAVEILHAQTGLKKEKLMEIIRLLHKGSSPEGENMRGAMIINQKGERVEKDHFRGVRTTDVDFTERELIAEKLTEKGFTQRTVDALAIATKNMVHPQITAEYCISDEPDYLTGYVATKDGYHRLTPLKRKGNSKGGRIYFVKDDTDLDELYRFLEKKPVLINDAD